MDASSVLAVVEFAGETSRTIMATQSIFFIFIYLGAQGIFAYLPSPHTSHPSLFISPTLLSKRQFSDWEPSTAARTYWLQLSTFPAYESSP